MLLPASMKSPGKTCLPVASSTHAYTREFAVSFRVTRVGTAFFFFFFGAAVFSGVAVAVGVGVPAMRLGASFSVAGSPHTTPSR